MNARDQIKTIEELGPISAAARQEGKRVVLAHGTFDLLHLGHVRHLESAKRQGDVLIVTVTADQFVNKGPGRPAFAEALRAEMLASISYVDWVAINHAPSAESVISVVKPHVYVKGSDYADEAADVTGKITQERERVEEFGGELVFTDEVTYSSSNLINQYLDINDPDARDFLNRLKKKTTTDQLFGLLESLAGLRVLFIGETIIDQYDYVTALGKTSKGHLVATQHNSQEVFAGGVIAAANHASGFCEKVDVVTFLGSQNPHRDIVENSLHDNVGIKIFEIEGRPTLRKRRFISGDVAKDAPISKIFEVYYMNDKPLLKHDSEAIEQHLSSVLNDYDLVVVCDFGHGLFTPGIIDLLCSSKVFLAINAQSNAGNMGYNQVTRYPRADYICIDEPEARLAASDKHSGVDQLIVDKLSKDIDCGSIVITVGRDGCIAWDRAAGAERVPGFGHHPIDTMGSGDAFLAVTSPLLYAGADMESAAFIGNVVGGLKVGVVGHRRAVDKVAVKKAITALLS